MIKFYFSFNFIKEKPFLMLKQCLTEDFNFFEDTHLNTLKKYDIWINGYIIKVYGKI